MANTPFGVKNVGSPCDIFSIVPRIDRQIRRRRASCVPRSFLRTGAVLGGARFSAMSNIIAAPDYAAPGAARGGACELDSARSAGCVFGAGRAQAGGGMVRRFSVSPTVGLAAILGIGGCPLLNKRRSDEQYGLLPGHSQPQE